MLEFLIVPRRNEFPNNSVVVELRNARLQSHTPHKDLSCGLVLWDFNLSSQFLRILSPARVYIYFLSQEIMPGPNVTTESEATKVTARGRLSELYDHGVVKSKSPQPPLASLVKLRSSVKSASPPKRTTTMDTKKIATKRQKHLLR
jgi:hypothetical protein